MPAANHASQAGLIRLGVAGLGAVAQAVYLPLIIRLPHVFRIAAVCELSPAVMTAVGERYGVPEAARHESLQRMLAAGGLDAVLLLTSGPHASAAMAALESGVPVLCEKPLAYTLAAADALAEVQARNNGRLMLGYMKLHDPAVDEVLGVMSAPGAPVGRVVRSVDVRVLHPTSESQLAFAHLLPPPSDINPDTLAAMADATAHEWSTALGPGAAELGPLYTDILLGSVVHDLAVVRALAGDPAAIDRVDLWPADTWPPSLAISGWLVSGARLSIAWHYLPEHPAYREEVRVVLDRGTVELTFPAPYRLNHPTEAVVISGSRETSRRTRFDSIEEAFERQLIAFAGMVHTGAPPIASIAEGRTDILTCQRIMARFAADRGIGIGGEAAALSP